MPRARGREGDTRGGACDRPIGDIAARDATRATTQCEDGTSSKMELLKLTPKRSRGMKKKKKKWTELHSDSSVS
jgi:hypothetical protein